MFFLCLLKYFETISEGILFIFIKYDKYKYIFSTSFLSLAEKMVLICHFLSRSKCITVNLAWNFWKSEVKTCQFRLRQNTVFFLTTIINWIDWDNQELVCLLWIQLLFPGDKTNVYKRNGLWTCFCFARQTSISPVPPQPRLPSGAFL